MAIRHKEFDLIILDWNTHEKEGELITSWIMKNITPQPFIVAAFNRGSENEAIKFLATDAITQRTIPFEFLKLLVKAATADKASEDDPGSINVFEGIHFDPIVKVVYLEGSPVTLTQREYDLAYLLFCNRGQSLSRSHIYEKLWRRSEDHISRTLDTHICRLRNKLKLTPDHGWKLTTIYGYGYRLDRLSKSQYSNPQKLHRGH
ncbi:Sensory transduction protein regX3 [Pseudomonas carbonaria]|uniref:Sensory transduction protein regX3 n=2 Tax=Zestomonas carbonaria TaxID=2762745 RepID=A0A7U7IAD9_9GAMM|nr:Sensory transduction protein regX3 [Pseudomonas carbonaria]